MGKYQARREAMVDCQIRPADVTKYPIIAAMLRTRRELFVLETLRGLAYVGGNLSIGHGRVLLDPRTLAKMLQESDILVSDVVLDVGAGMGYAAAVIARMAEAVVALEEDDYLAGEAEAVLADQRIFNVGVVTGSLVEGASHHGPYDVILIEGGVERVPERLVAQLKDGGRMACIFVNGTIAECRIGLKCKGRMGWRPAFSASAPVLAGFERSPEFVF